MDNKRYSNRMEKQVASDVGGQKQLNSGAIRHRKGDVVERRLLIECKTSTRPQKTYSIKKADLDKIKSEAFEAGKEFGILVFNFGDANILGKQDNYVVMRDTDFYTLLDTCSEVQPEFPFNPYKIFGKEYTFNDGPEEEFGPVTIVDEDRVDLTKFLSGEPKTFIQKRSGSDDNSDKS